MRKCDWTLLTDCRFSKIMEYMEEQKGLDYVYKHCNVCLMAEIARQLKLLAARQS